MDDDTRPEQPKSYGLFYNESEHRLFIVRVIRSVKDQNLFPLDHLDPEKPICKLFIRDLLRIMRSHKDAIYFKDSAVSIPTKEERKLALHKVGAAIATLEGIPSSVKRGLRNVYPSMRRDETNPLTDAKRELERLETILGWDSTFTPPKIGRPRSDREVNLLLALRKVINHRLSTTIPNNACTAPGKNKVTGEQENEFSSGLVEGLFQLANGLEPLVTRQNVTTSLSKLLPQSHKRV